MVLGIGIDAVEIERVKKLSETTINKIFHPKELESYKELELSHPDIKAQFLASRFAVKEAYAKARGTGFSDIVKPNEIYTCKEKDGRPFVVLCGKTLDNAPKSSVQVSITHEKPLAIAIVILESIGSDNGKS